MIAIIVDHPNRDLPSIVCLSEALIKSKVTDEVILVPFYFLDHFLLSSFFKKNIKCTIFNYLRRNILSHLKYSSDSGKFNIIYDTEGAPGKDGLQLYKSIESSKKYWKYIDHYLFWGSEQKKDIEKKFKVTFKSSSTGYIRFYEKTEQYLGKKKILINTNFAFADPKFNSTNREIKEFHKLGFSSLKKAQQKLEETSQRKKIFIKNIEEIIFKNSQEEFIIRPHPFEDIESYKTLVAKYSNLSFDNIQTSIKSLNQSKLLIHLDCTTAIESFYLGIPVLSLKWLKDDQSSIFKIAEQIGYQAKNIDQAVSFVHDKKYLKYKQADGDNLKRDIEGFFGNFDENSIDKNTKAINHTLISSVRKKIKTINFLNFKSYIKVNLYNLLSLSIYNKLLRFVRGQKIVNARKSKMFTKKNIETELDSKFFVEIKNKNFFVLKRKM